MPLRVHINGSCRACQDHALVKAQPLGSRLLLPGSLRLQIAAPQFSEDGKAAMSYITVQYACTRCHADVAIEDMAAAAEGYHD